jgi:hypothetical protein
MNQDNENNEVSEDQQAKRVVKALKERGLEVELGAYQTLRKRGWKVKLHSPHWDLKSSKEEMGRKIRTIDLNAARTIILGLGKYRAVQVHIVVECKWRKSENWVFYYESAEDMYSQQLLELAVTLLDWDESEAKKELASYSISESSFFNSLQWKQYKDILTSEMALETRKSSHHSMSNLPSVAISHMSVFAKSDIDNIRNSCEQVLDALDFQNEFWTRMTQDMMERNGPFSFWRNYPVIVFNGTLWKLIMTEDGELVPTKAKYVTYSYQRGVANCLIDIVSYLHLEDYLMILENELDSMKECVLKNKPWD